MQSILIHLYVLKSLHRGLRLEFQFFFFFSHEVSAKSKIVQRCWVWPSLFSPFPCYFLSFLVFVYQSYLRQDAYLLAYTGYPCLCICMSLEWFMDFLWISMCPSRTNLCKLPHRKQITLF